MSPKSWPKKDSTNQRQVKNETIIHKVHVTDGSSPFRRVRKKHKQKMTHRKMKRVQSRLIRTVNNQIWFWSSNHQETQSLRNETKIYCHLF